MNEETRLKLEAAAFRRLIQHLDERKDVQNIDLMILAGFGRNCLSNWYQEAAEEMGFNASQAELLVAQTFRGAVELQMKNDISCQEWINRVSSKGGTTEVAMKTFRATSVFEDIKSGAKAALLRAKELGKS